MKESFDVRPDQEAQEAEKPHSTCIALSIDTDAIIPGYMMQHAVDF